MDNSISIEDGNFGTVDPEKNYYAFNLGMSEDGEMYHSSYTIWVDFADDDHRVELRAPDLINAERYCETFRGMGVGVAVVNDVEDLPVFLCLGGRGLIEETVAIAHLADWLTPTPQIPLDVGFTNLKVPIKQALKRAPTPPLRMTVLKRDRYRCRICGRSPDNCSDVELHVHHIRPWAKRGVTDPINLITLCHTCHKGLEPHWDPDLGEIIAADIHAVSRLEADVLRYREYSLSMAEDMDDGSETG